MIEAGDLVESTDWREAGSVREVASVPDKGHADHGYCYLWKANHKAATRVLLGKNGLPRRYRLVKRNQTSIDEEE